MNREALGDKALENYTYDELLSRWEKADSEPNRYVFDYETGRLYEKRGSTWHDTSALSTSLVASSYVEDGVIEDAIWRKEEAESLYAQYGYPPQGRELDAQIAAEAAEPVLPSGVSPTELKGSLEDILLETVEPPTGWHVREYKLKDGTISVALEDNDGNGYALPQYALSQPGFLDGFEPDQLIDIATRGYTLAVQQAVKPTYLGGLPEDYTAENPNVWMQREAEAVYDKFGKFTEPELADRVQRPQGYSTEPLKPRYIEGDELYQFGGKDPAYLAGVQKSLVDAGYMNETDMYAERGSWGESSARAMYQAMYDANISGKEWTEIVRNRALNIRIAEQNEDADKTRRPTISELQADNPYVATARMGPDYATLSETVWGVMASALGREPHDWELALLADQINTDYSQSLDILAAADRANYDAGNRALATGEAQSAGTFEQVDPAARFQERFRQRYAGELNIIENREELQQNLGVMLTNLAGLESAVGGGY